VATGQTRYQVRFDWGATGWLNITEGADVVVFIDALRPGGAELPGSFAGPVLEATTGNASSTARWVLEQQADKGDRFAVAVVAMGEQSAGETRFCVEDLLVAGAVIDALAEVGIDYAAPEAAAAVAAFQGLRRAVSHILSASVSGQILLATGRGGAIEDARTRLDRTEVIRLS